MTKEASDSSVLDRDSQGAGVSGSVYSRVIDFADDETPLWHFPMMNDSVRNDGYDKALGSALKSKKGTVLEIGTGSGLLALMAARHGAAQVTTCEAVPSIAKKAKNIIQQNGYADRIRVFEGLSTNLAGGHEIPERFDVLVTEIFDDGLLGEGAFKSIRHAKEHLLKAGAQIIPARCRVMAMGIESKEIFQNYNVSTASGFDLRAFNEFTVRDYVGIHLDKMAYRALTLPTSIFTFDFNNLPTKESKPIDMPVTQSGDLHAIAYWFELYLDEDTVVSSGPGLAKLSSWKQAVQLVENVNAFQLGDQISAMAFHDESAIWFERR
jgi:predicted RNA methylase